MGPTRGGARGRVRLAPRQPWPDLLGLRERPSEGRDRGGEVTLDDVERWCYSCLTHYPHVLVEG